MQNSYNFKSVLVKNTKPVKVLTSTTDKNTYRIWFGVISGVLALNVAPCLLFPMRDTFIETSSPSEFE